MLVDTIKSFRKCLYTSMKKINNCIHNRIDGIINFKDIIYYSSIMIGNDHSYDSINAHLKIKNILDISKNALVKRKNNLDPQYINSLNNDLLNHIYNSDKPRIIGIDGTYILI